MPILYNYYVTAVRLDGIPVRFICLSYDEATRIFNEQCADTRVQFACYGDDTTTEPANKFCLGAEF